MTTINGVEFNMNSLDIVSIHKNIPNEEIGSDESFITDMGYTGLVLRLSGYELTLEKYDEVINEFMKPGVHTLVHRSDWQFKIYSTQYVPVLDKGIVDNWFPYELMMTTASPYRESAASSCRAKKITANNQEWSAEDISCNNLLNNWSFEDWSAGPSAAPDEWTNAGGGSIARESTTVKIGTYSVKIHANAGVTNWLYQEIPNLTNLKGKTITYGAWLYPTISTKTALVIDFGAGGEVYSSYPLIDTWTFVAITTTVPQNADYVKVRVFNNNGASDDPDGYFDGAVLIEGSSIPDSTFVRDIDTDGSVDAIPDIQVIGGKAEFTDMSQTTTDASNSAATTYGQTFTTSADVHSLTKLSFYTVNAANSGTLDIKIYDDDVKTTLLYSQIGATYLGPSQWNTVTFDNVIPLLPSTQYYVELSNLSTFFGLYRSNTSVYSGGQLYYNGVGDANKDQCFKTHYYKLINSIEIHNVAEPTIKCYAADDVLETAEHRINADGTGDIDYSDDFSTEKWVYNSFAHLGITHDETNDELDIADNGYIYWKCDAKYPITGIPTLTSRIDITAGTPTIQISEDAITWYDITTAMVDDVNTIYELDSSSLHIKEVGATEFYYRFDCIKAGAATCSIKEFTLNVKMITIDVEHPKISVNGANTFRCDQSSVSGMDCIVTLYYRDRAWAV